MTDYPTACPIPTLGAGPKFLVELGPTPAERYTVPANSERAAIERAQGEHRRRQESRDDQS